METKEIAFWISLFAIVAGTIYILLKPKNKITEEKVRTKNYLITSQFAQLGSSRIAIDFLVTSNYQSLNISEQADLRTIVDTEITNSKPTINMIWELWLSGNEKYMQMAKSQLDEIALEIEGRMLNILDNPETDFDQRKIIMTPKMTIRAI